LRKGYSWGVTKKKKVDYGEVRKRKGKNFLLAISGTKKWKTKTKNEFPLTIIKN